MSPIANKQQGVILITGLILLMVITLIGITSMHSVVLSEKMTANMRDTEVSFQATESALSDGEQWLMQQTAKPAGVSACTSAPCEVWENDVLANIWISSDSWWQTNARPFSSTIYGVSTQPYFIIEEFGFFPYELSPDARAKGLGYHYYRVTARGNGQTNTTRTIIESIYATQFN